MTEIQQLQSVASQIAFTVDDLKKSIYDANKIKQEMQDVSLPPEFRIMLKNELVAMLKDTQETFENATAITVDQVHQKYQNILEQIDQDIYSTVVKPSADSMEAAESLKKSGKIIQNLSKMTERWVMVSIVGGLLLFGGAALGGALGYQGGLEAGKIRGASEEMRGAGMHTELLGDGYAWLSTEDGQHHAGECGMRSDKKFGCRISLGPTMPPMATPIPKK
jgi:hypothetical protein